MPRIPVSADSTTPHRAAKSAQEPQEKAERLGYLGMALFVGSLLLTPVDRAEAAIIRVNSLADNSTGSDGLVTLREAITASENNSTTDLGDTGSGLDTIVFEPNVAGTLYLTSGHFLLNQAVTISGPGQDILTIDAQGSSRIFYFHTDDTVDGVTISSLTLTGGGNVTNGGAIFAEHTLLTVADCTFTNNEANDNGGGIFFRGQGSLYSLNVTGSTFTNNEADGRDGGGIYAENGKVTLTDCTFSNNTAGDDGGALGSDDLFQLDITDSTFQNNHSYGTNPRGGGGGINLVEMRGPVTITGSTISNNSAEHKGGGIAIENTQTSTPIRIASSYVENNTSDNDGGGIFCEDANFTISSTSISGNDSDQNGGGVLAANCSPLQVTGSTFFQNDSGNFGGGLFAGYSGPTLISDCTFDDNYAYDVGGGINLAIVSGPVLISNCVVTSNYSHDDGGGIYFYALMPNSPLTIVNATILGNTSYDDGGGIAGYALAFNSDVTLLNCTVSSNTSIADDGGGLAIDGMYLYSAVNIDRCRFLNNTSTDRGGGVYFSTYYYYYNGNGGPDTGKGLLTIRNSTFDGNGALGPSAFGGGIYCFSSDSGQASHVLQIEGSTISNNTSSSLGGGICFESFYASFRISNTTVSGNQCLNSVGGGMTASVVNQYEGCYVENCTFYDNYAYDFAGGLLFNAGITGLLEVSGSIISGNSTGSFAPDIRLPFGTIYSQFSLIGHPDYAGTFVDGPGNIFYQYAYLEPLASNGGPTKTHALSVSSPAIDAGINAALAPFDQRGNGYPRTVNGQTDMGAFEYNPDAPPPSELFGFGGDTDGDGFSDDAEDTAGTDPNDPTDTPLGSILSSEDQIEPLSVLKLQVSLKFSKPGGDTIKVKGRFQLPDGTPIAGETVLVDVAGNSVAFQLDDNPRGAKGVSGLSKIKVGAPKGGVASCLLLLKGDFQSACAQNADLQNETTDKVGEARIIRVALLFGQEAVFRTDVVTSYKAKQDKSGKAK